jgi:hypothetical protein
VEEATTLIIGSWILDFPDGFFDTPARQFDMNVQLSFHNTTQDKRFAIYTNRGYFYFQSNGTDDYVLEKFQLKKTKIGDTTYNFGGQTINMKIAPSPNKIIYIGHVVFTYAAPEAAKRSGRTSYYDYDIAVDVDWNKQALKDYIMEHNGAAWLDREIVEYGKK